MKNFSLFIFLILCTLGLNAQSAKDEISKNVYLSAANYYAYPTPQGSLTPAPKGYKPYYLSHYARHGSRFLINPQDYQMPLAILQKAKENGVLSSDGEKALFVIDSISRMAEGRYGELTALGARQHKGIAGRMYHNFPEIFASNATIDARSTVVIRCILSMNAECMQLKAMNPHLVFKNDASYHDMFYMNNNPDWLKKLRKKDEVTSAMEDFKNAHVHPERLMASLFTDKDFVKKNQVDSAKLMTTLFDVACNMQSHDTQMELYSLFTKDECYDLWQIGNVNWYLGYGPAPLTGGLMPYIETNLLENFLNTADTCVTKKENSATLRFGHEVCVLPLVCLLELDDFGKQINDLNTLDSHWKNYEIYPMACNVQFVFYRKKGSEDILVKVLLNEKEAKLPVKTDLAPYYHWNDVESYYRAKIAKSREAEALYSHAN
ncbi:MAG: hypothetical protein PHD21_00570 [Flavobacteriales bacterium]|nr:hypothetical protein [Flavobacteriales bacterium]